MKVAIETRKFDHILRAQQFDRSFLEEELFPEAKKMEILVKARIEDHTLSNKTVCLLFYEPSTRTRLSFQQAAHLLGAKTSATENAREFSSAIKGESLKDTIRTVNALGFDAIVLRHDQSGAAEEAARVSNIPIFNAGDGNNQHPTQALLDLYTIHKQFSEIDNLNVAMVGDLKNGRTVRSLTYLLSKFNKIHIDLVSPPSFQMARDLLDHLDEKGVSYSITDELRKVAGRADVIYLTRLQKERLFGEIIDIDKSGVVIDEGILSQLKNDAIVMHPLPRSDDFGELPERFANHQRVAIFDQVANGLYTRMALLKMLLS